MEGNSVESEITRRSEGLKRLSNSVLSVTDTELTAISAPASSGLTTSRITGYNSPAPIGIPSVL